MLHLASIAATLLISAPLHATASAQAVDPMAAQVEAARKAAAERRTQLAVDLADAVLARRPGHPEAIVVKMQALSEADDLDGATEAYEAFIKAGGTESVEALRPLARAHLRDLSRIRTSTIAAGALEALARSGDAESRAALEEAAWPKTEGAFGSPAAIDALARLGHERAIEAVVARLDDAGWGQRTAALDVLVAADPLRLVRALPRLIAVDEPGQRVAAIDAAGRSGRREAIALVKPLVNDPMLLIRLHAAVALKRLGDAGGDTVLADALRSPLPDARLLAARAFAGSDDRQWVAALVPLLDDPNGFNRFVAAELLAPVMADRALPVLEAGIADPNPAIRDVALKALLAQSTPTITMLRPLLADLSPWVRVQAAAALVR